MANISTLATSTLLKYKTAQTDIKLIEQILEKTPNKKNLVFFLHFLSRYVVDILLIIYSIIFVWFTR